MFADRIKGIKPSGIREIFKLAAQMQDPVNFSIGQADFDVPDDIKHLAQQFIGEGFNKYTQTDGLPELKSAILNDLKKRYDIKQSQVMVTSGVSGGLLLSFLTLVNPGDEVLIPDPYFMMYDILVNLCGGTSTLYDTYPNFRLDAAAIEAKITPRTKLLLLNSPANPTGTMYTEAELRAVADVARRHNLIIVSDEIYERFRYDGPHVSVGQFYEKTILLGGFSKSFAMPGWRVGYALGPEEILDRMLTLQQFSFVCAPAPFQKACAAAIQYDMTPYIDAYRRKRDLLCEGLAKNFELTPPAGAFYAFPKVPWGTDQEFVKKAIENKVLVIPGGAFSAHKTHFRISFAIDDAGLRKGIDILNRIAEQGA